MSRPDDLRAEGRAEEATLSSASSGVHVAAVLGVAVPRPPGIPREGVEFRESYLAESAAIPSLPKPKIPLAPVLSAPVDGDTGRVSLTSLAPSIARFGRFELLGRLAVGGMAEIFLSRENVDEELARNLVVKILRKPSRGNDSEGHFEQLFLREGRVAAQLMHPNICHVYEFGRHRGHYFIAMEYVEGASLRDVLARQPAHRLDPYLAAWTFGQVAAALHYAHTARDARRRPLGVVHRDVSPQNIMIRYDGIVKLLDFGVAHVAAADDAERAGMLFGKLAYMAPEQCRGSSAIDGRADVFSLGVCLYEALTGRRLYRRKDDVETVRALLEEPVPSVRAVDPSLPEALSRIVSRALSKKPEQRFANAGEMQQALARFVASSGRAIGATDAARLMRRDFRDQLSRGPELTTSLDLSELTGPASIVVPDASSLAPRALEGAPKPARTVSLRAALLLALVVAISAWLASRSSSPAAAPEANRRAGIAGPPAPAAAPPPLVVEAPRVEPVVPVEPSAPTAPEPAASPEPERDGLAPDSRAAARPGFIKNAGF